MKIQYFINVSFCLFLLWTVVACEKEGVDEQDIEVPEGYALSAGISTIFLNSSKAYDTPADWLSGNYASRFNRGDKLYDDVRTTDNSYISAERTELFFRITDGFCMTRQFMG